MLNEDIKLRPGSARKARAQLRRRLADLGVDGDHILSVELVVAELVATALEQEGSAERGSGRLSLELFPLLTSVRLRCPHDVELVDEPLALRDRMLGRLTVAVGRRRNTDGSVDLWAEVAHPVVRAS
jgi:hypothetical protein